MFQGLGGKKTACPVHPAAGAKQVGTWGNDEGEGMRVAFHVSLNLVRLALVSDTVLWDSPLQSITVKGWLLKAWFSVC